MTISKPTFQTQIKNHQIFVTQKKNPIPKPTKTWTNKGGGERSVAFPVWVVTCGSCRGRGFRSLDVWHTNLDSNPNPNRSTNSKLSLPWLWSTKASVRSTRSEPSVRNQQQWWWGKAWKFLENCFYDTDSKRVREQDDSFAVVGKGEKRAYERERR